MTEFELIKHYFTQHTPSRNDVILGIGDDAALVSVPPNQLLAISTDTFIQGIHFPECTSAYEIGYKSLAVNLSDMAAMGAEPAWMTLALSLPAADENWLQAFAAGLFSLANQYNIQLIGGDTTRSPVSITISVYGFTRKDTALRRDTAKPGDKIYVSGTLGDAGLGLQAIQNKCTLSDADRQRAIQRLDHPIPRVELGVALRSLATSAIDISDGLMADLGHIAQASQVGAMINSDALPLSDLLTRNMTHENAKILALTAGDDYELCFTIPPDKLNQLLEVEKKLQVKLTCIGKIITEQKVQINGISADPALAVCGFRHF